MRFDETIKKIKDTSFIIFAILFVLAFIVTGVKYGYSFFKNKEMFKNLINFPDELIIGLLGILLAFASIIGYLTYKVISRDIGAETKKLWEEERKISKADTAIALGYFHIRLYKTLYKEKTEPEEEDKDRKAKTEIENAISKVQQAIDYLKGIKEEKCLRQIFLSENNLAYFLARKWNYYGYYKNSEGEIKQRDDNSFKEYLEKNDLTKEYKADKRMAEGYVEELKNKKASEIYPDLKYNLEDTYEWVKQIFSIDVEIKIRG